MTTLRHERHKDLLLNLIFSILDRFPYKKKYLGKYENTCVNCAGPAQFQPKLLELEMS